MGINIWQRRSNNSNCRSPTTKFPDPWRALQAGQHARLACGSGLATWSQLEAVRGPDLLVCAPGRQCGAQSWHVGLIWPVDQPRVTPLPCGNNRLSATALCQSHRWHQAQRLPNGPESCAGLPSLGQRLFLPRAGRCHSRYRFPLLEGSEALTSPHGPCTLSNLPPRLTSQVDVFPGCDTEVTGTINSPSTLGEICPIVASGLGHAAAATAGAVARAAPTAESRP